MMGRQNPKYMPHISKLKTLSTGIAYLFLGLLVTEAPISLSKHRLLSLLLVGLHRLTIIS